MRWARARSTVAGVAVFGALSFGFGVPGPTPEEPDRSFDDGALAVDEPNPTRGPRQDPRRGGDRANGPVGRDSSLRFRPRPGRIVGRVVDTRGEPIRDVCVDVWRRTGQRWLMIEGIARTDARGRYVARPPAADGRRQPVKVRFRDCRRDARFAFAWFDGAADVADARMLYLEDGPVAGAVLPAESSIAGVVTSGSGAAVPGACVWLYDGTIADQGGFVYVPLARAVTGEDGRYQFDGLAAKSYRLLFRAETADRRCTASFVPEWYADAGPGSRPTAAEYPSWPASDPVAMDTGQARDGVDARVALTGRITGAVAPVPADCAAGGDSENPHVTVHEVTTGDLVAGASVACDGAYAIGGLAPGTYKVRFDVHDESYDVEWFDDKPSFALANPVSVREGEDTGGISATLEPR